LELRKNLFSEREVMQWHRLPRDVLESLSLEAFKYGAEGRALVRAAFRLHSMTLEVSSNLNGSERPRPLNALKRRSGRGRPHAVVYRAHAHSRSFPLPQAQGPAGAARGRSGGGWGCARCVRCPGGGGAGGAAGRVVAGMERLERCARCLRARLVAAAVRRRLPWLLLGLVFLGSALKDGDLVPETPMQNKRNVFNV